MVAHTALRGTASDSAWRRIGFCGIPGVRASDSAWPRIGFGVGPPSPPRKPAGFARRPRVSNSARAAIPGSGPVSKSAQPAHRPSTGSPQPRPQPRPGPAHRAMHRPPTGVGGGRGSSATGNRAGGSRWASRRHPGGCSGRGGRPARRAVGRNPGGITGTSRGNLGITHPRPRNPGSESCKKACTSKRAGPITAGSAVQRQASSAA